MSAPFTGAIHSFEITKTSTSGVITHLIYELDNPDYYVDFGANRMWIIRLLPGDLLVINSGRDTINLRLLPGDVLVINSGGDTINLCEGLYTRASKRARRARHITTHSNILSTH
jgi:hypothetical protein